MNEVNWIKRNNVGFNGQKKDFDQAYYYMMCNILVEKKDRTLRMCIKTVIESGDDM